jgi:hypothetical protein
MAYQSIKSPFPKAKPNAKEKAISNHKCTTKSKDVAKPQAPKPKSKAAKSNTGGQNKPSGGNDNATYNNLFVDKSSSGHYSWPYNPYSTDLSDPHGGFRQSSSAFNGYGFPDTGPYTNGVGGNAQNNYVSTGSSFSLPDHTNVNNADHYGNGFSNSYSDSFGHSSQYPHDESYDDGQLDGLNDKKALGSNASDSVHIKQEKQEHSGINNESDEDYIDVNKTPKTRKDGTSRKPRQPRPKLLKWNDNDWKQLVLGIVWACGEAGISIPFAQAAQVVHDGCTAGALQQAILKLRVKQNAAGEQVPPLRMAWTRNKTGNATNNGDQTSTPPKGPTRAMIARRKPTRHQQNQTLMFTFKRAYAEEDRALLPFPYRYNPVSNGDFDMEVVDEHGRRDSTYTLYDGGDEDVLDRSSSKQIFPNYNDSYLNDWPNSDAMDTEVHGQDYSDLSNTIGAQLQGHITTDLAGTLGSQFQEHGLTILNSPVSHQIQKQNYVDLTDSLSNQLQKSSQAGLSNAYISPQSGLAPGLFSMEKESENQMVDVNPINWDINGLPAGPSTEVFSFDFSINDNVDVPVMSIEHLSNGQLVQECGGPSTPTFNAPFSLGFDGQSNQPLGDRSSTDSNVVFSPTYDCQFGQESGQSSQTSTDQLSQPFVGNFNHSLNGLSYQGSSNNSHCSFGDYATQGANTPAGQAYPIDFQKDFVIPHTGRDPRNNFSAVNTKKMVVPKGSIANARYM